MDPTADDALYAEAESFAQDLGSTTYIEVVDPASEASKPKKPRAKTEYAHKRVRLTLTELPDDWKAYAEETFPGIDAEKAFEDFCDFWKGKAKDPLAADWKRVWQRNVRTIRDTPTLQARFTMKQPRSLKSAIKSDCLADYI